MAMNKKFGIATVAAVVLATAAGGWYFTHRKQDDALRALVLQGNVDMRQVSLAFNGSGRIASLPVREGERVQVGQVLGELDSTTLALQVQQAEAQLAAREQLVRKLKAGARPQERAQASASIRAADIEVDLARKQLSRMQQSNASSAGEAVSRNDIDTARARLEMAQAKRESARQAGALLDAGARREDIAEASAQVDAARAQLDLLRRNLADTRLIAPLAGVIRSRLQEVGDLTSPQKPVYAVALNDAKWVRVYVPETALGKVREGMPAQIRTDSAPQEPLAGQVGYIASVAEFTPKTVQTEELRSSLVYEVRIQTRDPQDQLRLGMPATVSIDLTAAPAPVAGSSAAAAAASPAVLAPLAPASAR